MSTIGAYQTYMETTVSTSDPLELTRLLYRAGIDALRRARTAVAAGNINERTSQVSRTYQVIAELASSLHPEESPELALRLAQIYEYALFLVQKGNYEQHERPLAEAQELLETLLAGWEQCQPSTSIQRNGTAA